MEIKNGEIILDKYQIEGEPITNGNTARVWKAFHKEWEIYLALKQPKTDFIANAGGKENFCRECDTWIKLGHHPHIVPCFYVREIDNELIVFSEWCDGGNLQSGIDSGAIFSGTPKEQEQRIVSVALQAMLGLRYAHKMGVIHKDIKPVNIMLTKDYSVRITDFGSSNYIGETGTQRYLSPEQLASNLKKITCKTDVFSWALVVSAMHRGERYWDEPGGDACAYFEKELSNLKVGMRKEYIELIKDCLAVNPDNRPDADTVIQRIRTIYSDILKNDIALNYIDVEYAEETADSLNNAALSYLDIGEYEKGEKCWQKALELQPTHTESIYNYNVFLWRKGAIPDYELRRKIKLISQNIKDDYLEEIRRYSGLRLKYSLASSTEEQDWDGDTIIISAGAIDSIRYNEDGSKILASSKDDKCQKIWDVKEEKCLSVIPYDESPESVSDERWNAPIFSVGNIVLEELDKNPIRFVIKNVESGCIIGSYCDDYASPYDIEYSYSFSTNENVIAISDLSGNINVYELPEQGAPKPVLCKFIPHEELLENKQNYLKLKSDIEECIEFEKYKTAVELMNQMTVIPLYGNSTECHDIKKKLLPYCKRSNFRASLIERYSEKTEYIRFSTDGKYYLKINGENYLCGSDGYVYVYKTGNFRKAEILIAPKHKGIVSVKDAWFLPNGNIRLSVESLTETEEITQDFYTVFESEYFLEEYDFETNILRVISSEPEKAPERSIPQELMDFCKEYHYEPRAFDVNPDCTMLIAGDEDEFAVFDIDCDIEYDEEKANAFIEEKNRRILTKENSSHEEETFTMSDNTENFNSCKCNSCLINDNNRFLIEMTGGRANEPLERLSKITLKNPNTVFQINAKAAKEYLDGFTNGQLPPPHPNNAVELLIRASDDEFTKMMKESERQSKYWDKKPELLLTTVLMNTIKREKTTPFISYSKVAEEKGLSLFEEKGYILGLDECNSFLSEIDEEAFQYFCKLSSIRLLNPYNDFSMKVQGAMYWKANHTPDEKSDNPEIQKLIDIGQEEFNEIVRENERQAYYWHGSSDASFLTLLMRTLDPDENEKAEKAMGKENRFSDFTHRPDTVARRQSYLPKLTDKVNRMREALLENIMGQDHAVHGFCEGLFNSEVLLQADEERVRPRAVFTFAGPPGVGKTYLAEQAAKYLGRPFKRFDMTEYSENYAHLGLIGFESTWKDSTPGLLTTYVSENPECVLLFDEIEKAHPQVIQIFFQMLDAGVVSDKYYSTKILNGEDTEDNRKRAKVSFKDTIIIFTTNAGRSLYEGEYGDNCAGVPTKTVLNALKTEINPLTNNSFFPTAIVSRIATGYPILFNNLKPHHLVCIIEKEVKRVQVLFEKQYGIKISADREAVMSLLYSEGGTVDARSLRARVDLFFKNEFFKILSSDEEGLTDVVNYDFCTETDNLPTEISKLFKRDTTPEILIYANKIFGEICQRQMNGFIFHIATDIDEAIRLAGEKDISFAVIDIAKRSYNNNEDNAEYEGTMLLSMAASGWKDGKKLFSTLRTRLPELPIYILESTIPLNDDIVSAFERAGARGKLIEPSLRGYTDFENQLMTISDQLYMQSIANDLAIEHKAICFETAPKMQGDRIRIMLRNFELRQVPDADDADDLMSETEKPKERFDDVIGANSAKKELKFFVDFLKNPKRFAAQGYRMPKGVLLYGKPGTGKTMLAKALAGEAGVTFIPTVASSFVKQHTGTGPAAIRELFKKARRYAPSIVFIDEVDTIAKKRTGSGSSEENTLNTLLAEMDGFTADSKRPVFVLAATNFGIEAEDGGVGVLDEAFVRRFDRKIKIELPDKEDRIKLITLMLSKISNHNVTEAVIENIASRSVGTSPAILTSIMETAKRIAFDIQKPIDDKILEEAYEITKHGDKKYWGDETLKQTACHECGHAIISILGGNTPSYLTIEARGSHGGYMEHSEEEKDAFINTKNDLIWMIRTSLGGRAAEIVCFGEDKGITTGVSSDIFNATHIAKMMITRYAMDEKLGLAYMSDEAAEKSSEVRERINEILSEQLSESIKLINDNRDKFDRLCNELLLKNRLTGDEIEELFKVNNDN